MGGGWLPVAGLFGPRRPNHGGAHALPLKYNTETQSNTTAWDGAAQQMTEAHPVSVNTISTTAPTAPLCTVNVISAREHSVF